MPKRLVICCDGTWNRRDQTKGGVPCPTNVSKIASGIADAAPDGTAQVAHYEAGVGTRRFEQLRGGALGFGLSRNVQSCYRFVVQNYEPGDELFLFGFSRGAFTARSCAGLLRNAGILRREHEGQIDAAYKLYRAGEAETKPNGTKAIAFRKQWSHPDTDIAFIGVWDTVGSLGIPIDGIRLPFLTKLWSFHDTELSGRVRRAHHALAIDERRKPFRPTLWTQPDDAPDQLLEQVWFSGVHCDVGGGYLDPDLADVALAWMVNRAGDAGLAFHPGHFTRTTNPGDTDRASGAAIDPDPLGRLHDSRKGIYKLQPAIDRNLRGDRTEVSPSAIERYDAMPSYRPPQLKAFLGR